MLFFNKTVQIYQFKKIMSTSILYVFIVINTGKTVNFINAKLCFI